VRRCAGRWLRNQMDRSPPFAASVDAAPHTPSVDSVTRAIPGHYSANAPKSDLRAAIDRGRAQRAEGRFEVQWVVAPAPAPGCPAARAVPVPRCRCSDRDARDHAKGSKNSPLLPAPRYRQNAWAFPRLSNKDVSGFPGADALAASVPHDRFRSCQTLLSTHRHHLSTEAGWFLSRADRLQGVAPPTSP